MTNFPATVAKLLEYLDEAYPHKCPKLDQSEREIFMYAGRRELIDQLIERFNREQGGA